jgi:early secretory antigenic target protein ESAT-6
MSEQVWNFAAIEACAGEIQGYAASVHGLLDEGTGSLGRLQAAWPGPGPGADVAVEQCIDRTERSAAEPRADY